MSNTLSQHQRKDIAKNSLIEYLKIIQIESENPAVLIFFPVGVQEWMRVNEVCRKLFNTRVVIEEYIWYLIGKANVGIN